MNKQPQYFSSKFKAIRSMILVGVVGIVLSGCAKQAPLCEVADISTWNAHKGVVAGITAPGRVHGKDFKFQHKGNLQDDFQCQPERIWCPEPDADKGCQLFTCQGTTEPGDVIRITDVDNVVYFSSPEATSFTWDGANLRCN